MFKNLFLRFLCSYNFEACYYPLAHLLALPNIIDICTLMNNCYEFIPFTFSFAPSNTNLLMPAYS